MPGRSFVDVLCAEAQRIQRASPPPTSPSPPTPSPTSPASVPAAPSPAHCEAREALQARLQALEATAARLSPLAPGDQEVAALFESKRREAESVRGQLRALRPLRSQLLSAMDARDKRRRKVAELREKEAQLCLVLNETRVLLAAEVHALEAVTAEVVELQSRPQVEDEPQPQPAEDTARYAEIHAALPPHLQSALSSLMVPRLPPQHAYEDGYGPTTEQMHDAVSDIDLVSLSSGYAPTTEQMHMALGVYGTHGASSASTASVIAAPPSQAYGPAPRPCGRIRAEPFHIAIETPLGGDAPPQIAPPA